MLNCLHQFKYFVTVTIRKKPFRDKKGKNKMRQRIIKDWEKWSTIIALISSIIAGIGLGFAVMEIHQTKRWNKLNFTFTYLPSPLELSLLENEFDEIMDFWKRKDELKLSEVRALLDEMGDSDKVELCKKYDYGSWNNDIQKKWSNCGKILKQYLSLLERYCGAINCGVADGEVSKSLYGFRFKAHYHKLLPFINKMREKKCDNSLFCEFENVVKSWNEDKKVSKSEY